jgi:hypothetical protein
MGERLGSVAVHWSDIEGIRGLAFGGSARAEMRRGQWGVQECWKIVRRPARPQTDHGSATGPGRTGGCLRLLIWIGRFMQRPRFRR